MCYDTCIPIVVIHKTVLMCFITEKVLISYMSQRMTKPTIWPMWPANTQISLRIQVSFTKTYLYNFDLVKPHFYIVKLGFTVVYIICLISAKKHR